MRLVRSLLVLIAVLPASAWVAPTQAELPRSWPRAALQTLPVAERDRRGVVGCESAVQGAAAYVCNRLPTTVLIGRLDQDDCGQALVCEPGKGGDHGGAGNGTGRLVAGSTRGQIKVVFSNATERDDRLYASAARCVAGMADAPAGIPPRPRICLG